MFQYYHVTGNCLPLCVWYFSILFPSVLPCNGKWSSYQCVWYFSILFPSVLPCKADFSTNVYCISVYYSLQYCNVTGNCLPVCVAFQGTIPFSISMYRGMVYQCVCCISVYCSLQYYLVTGMVYQCVCVIFQYTVPFSLPWNGEWSTSVCGTSVYYSFQYRELSTSVWYFSILFPSV